MATSTAEANAAGSGAGNQVATPGPSPAAAPRAVIDMARIQALATRAGSMVEQIRARLLAPEARKISPLYSASQIATLGGVDKALAGVDWLKAHPAAVGVAVAVAVAASPKRAWRWSRRAFFVWRGWRTVRNSLLAVRST